MAVTLPSNFLARKEAVTKMRNIMRGLNVLTAVVQIVAGLGSVSELVKFDVSGVLIAVYGTLFAVVLLCYECRFRLTDVWLHENFGFLFSYRGLAAYLLFVGLLDLGLVGDFYAILAGSSAIINAMLVLVVGLCTPKARGPTAFPTIATKPPPSYGSSQLVV